MKGVAFDIKGAHVGITDLDAHARTILSRKPRNDPL
jgi:hypothetical protein